MLSTRATLLLLSAELLLNRNLFGKVIIRRVLVALNLILEDLAGSGI
jgi:hypothetical protein